MLQATVSGFRTGGEVVQTRAGLHEGHHRSRLIRSHRAAIS
jgi:hypothetical protein